jgi:hypothetical protein
MSAIHVLDFIWVHVRDRQQSRPTIAGASFLYKATHGASVVPDHFGNSTISEGDMRFFLIVASVASALLGLPGFSAIHSALAAECTGTNCPPPGQGGHDCEHEKRQPTTS